MFEFASDLEAFSRQIDEIADRQMPYALALALNDTADDVLAAVRDLIGGAFDRPTPYTQNAFAVTQRASRSDPEVRVGLRDNRGVAHYLRVEQDGGPRRKTKLETMLTYTVATGAAWQAVVPGDNAALDRYGNWSAGERNRAVSGIKGWREAGYSANRTDRSAKRARRYGETYFVPQHGLPPGIYRRKGRDLDIIAMFVGSVPTYTPRFPFEESAARVAQDRLPDHFQRRFEEAMATARLLK